MRGWRIEARRPLSDADQGRTAGKESREMEPKTKTLSGAEIRRNSQRRERGELWRRATAAIEVLAHMPLASDVVLGCPPKGARARVADQAVRVAEWLNAFAAAATPPAPAPASEKEWRNE